jgi:hypothetical protein
LIGQKYLPFCQKNAVMKNSFFLLAFVLLYACSPAETTNASNETSSTSLSLTQNVMPDSLLRHVVMFGFKETSSPEDIDLIVKAFNELPSKISEIKGFEWGVNSSPEGLNQGLTHAFTVTFYSDADRDTYIPHPAHQEFVGLLGPHLEKVTVVDYWTTK